MHIDEILEKRTIDIRVESGKLYRLFAEDEQYYQYSSRFFSFFDVLDNHFRDLPVSCNSISYTEFLDNGAFDASNIKSFSLLVEKVLTLCFQVRESASKTTINHHILDKKIQQIVKMLSFDLGKLSLRYEFRNNPRFGTLAYVFRNDAIINKAIEAAPDLLDSIIDYNRPSNKGNLVEKEKDLHLIIKEVEHIAQNKNFKYEKVAKQAECIFNMFHIRHDNIKGKFKNNILSKMNDEDLEDVFDMGYRLCLELLILNEFDDIDQKVDDLRKMMKQDKI